MFERTQNLRLSVIKQMELRASKFPDVISLAQGSRLSNSLIFYSGYAKLRYSLKTE